jgi:hypothetical protein
VAVRFNRLSLILILSLAFVALTGCSTLLYVRSPQQRTFADPAYESSKIFFFFGLAGGPHDVYVDQICLGKDIDQVSTEYTPSDVLKGFLTLGIYTPRTVKVWCQL